MKERRLVRSATLKGYFEAATQAGLDPQRMLKEVGIPPDSMRDPDEMISFDAFLTLLGNSAERTGLMDFGIRAAIARGIPDFGAVSLLMREADDVESAVRLMTSHLRLHSDGTFIHLDTRFDYPIIAIEMNGRTTLESMQVTQFATVGVVSQIRWLLAEDYRPELVCFAFAAPPDTQLAQRFFKCEVLHNQNVSGIVLDKAVLRRPLVTSPPFLRKLALKQLRPLLERGQDTFAMRITRMISQRLEDGDVSSGVIASELGIDRRTLNRRLAKEGVTYLSLVQDVRKQVARQALTNPDQSLTELSCSTGFQSLSAFSRWFQGTFGCSATAFRARSARARGMDEVSAETL